MTKKIPLIKKGGLHTIISTLIFGTADAASRASTVKYDTAEVQTATPQ